MTPDQEETILQTLADLIPTVRWTSYGDTTPLTRKFINDPAMNRRVRLFSDLDAKTQQPACFQAEWASDEMQVSNLPYKTTLAANWIAYQSRAKDKTFVGARENNAIIGGIREVLKPKPSDRGFADRRNTLGGLVYHCFISGRIFKDPGDIDDQAMIVVPIKLLVP